jgi:hypothetical protein
MLKSLPAGVNAGSTSSSASAAAKDKLFHCSDPRGVMTMATSTISVRTTTPWSSRAHQGTANRARTWSSSSRHKLPMGNNDADSAKPVAFGRRGEGVAPPGIGWGWVRVREEVGGLAREQQAQAGCVARDGQEFRVRAGMMGRKEISHGPTQGAAHP